MSQALTDKLLIHAARTDNVQLFTSVTMAEPRVPYDVNFADGIGNTALHYACAQASIQVIDALLDEEVDVDVRNRLEGNTPLHEACRVEHEEARNWIVSELFSAGADPRIRNAAGLTPDATVVGQRAQTPLGKELINMLTSGQGMAALGADDIADDDGGAYFYLYRRCCRGRGVRVIVRHILGLAEAIRRCISPNTLEALWVIRALV